MQSSDKIYFSLPGFYLHFNLIKEVLYLYETERFKFKDNVVIDSLYDSFPCIWNGGRFLFGETNLANIRATFAAFHQKIGLRLTFTNSLLTSQHCLDTLGNVILEEAVKQSPQVGITVNSPVLKNYIEEKYPNLFYFNWSATKVLEDIAEINALSENDCVIPSYQLINNNFDKLQLLKYPQNIELICDEACIDNCPHRATHYCSFNKVQLFQEEQPEVCPYAPGKDFYGRKTGRKHNISPLDIETKYLPLGFQHFKIAGREDIDVNLIESFVYYLIKDEYKDEVRNHLLNLCY